MGFPIYSNITHNTWDSLIHSNITRNTWDFPAIDGNETDHLAETGVIEATIFTCTMN